ncbi:MAG TPA: phosphoenolpyruvate carboxylase [Arenimonas sp.]|uniref:phosphoenolpyruvate carboxylase n=1 Tax=Arenimonas sp. TaxID=1872635 RepID=UPI002C7AC535|nr:phosphoenolpyruvate carboxylase [Arenimonas sp.]HMB58047.1 phosphoenolpyruvate carboxylase [Arenimonas sp.]
MPLPAAPVDDSQREIDFPVTDEPLREDVGRLGALVGEILSEQVGADFLAEVERIRKAAIARRESDGGVEVLAQQLSHLPLARAEDLVRAFATYFSAVNLAELVHRIRRQRDYQRAGASAQPGGLREVAAALRDAGVDADELRAALADCLVQPVFTAHPTEAVRRALLEKERMIVRALVAGFDEQRTPAERRADLAIIRTALTAAWQTEESAPEKPTVADELEHVSFYLTEVLYRILPVFHEIFEDALGENFPGVASPDGLLRFGSWVGGDMDGNPNVGAETIAATLATQRALVLAAYRADLRNLAQLLSQSATRVAISAAVLARIDDYRALLPPETRPRPRWQDMPYRALLDLIVQRLRATEAGLASGYGNAAEFTTDLELIGDSLRSHHGEQAGWFALRRVLRRARCFGFHLATLDVRQDSRQHDIALAALFADAGYAARDIEQRLALLRPLLLANACVSAADAPAAVATLAVFRTMAASLPRYGRVAFGLYIISMSRSAADVLAVLALARLGGCVDGDGAVPLDIAPLFETVADLQASQDVLRTLFAEPAYRDHLARRGGVQWVMLGYSDSAKDGGLIASRWALQRTQVELTELSAQAGIVIRYFHGRGGSVSRGGSKTERAVIAAPRGSINGVLRVTEQGEVIHRKYGIRAIALRNLEQAAGAVLRATLRPRAAEPREVRWREIVAVMAEVARGHYRGLVYDTPEFPEYFRAATPIDVIERLRIGSRPSRRGGSGGVDSLRAIPWVFSWSQNRAGLTAWYGAGTGLSAAIAEHGLATIQEMASDWPFLVMMLDDLEMVLAKSDMAIFERYSQLAGPLHAQLYPRIAEEFSRTREALLMIKGQTGLLEGDRRFRRSIRLRNPYVDPISLLQVDLLARWREAGRPEDALFAALVATVNGIAAGVQNTG